MTYLLTPWSRVLPEKLTVSQLVKNFHAFFGTRRLFTAFTIARHLSLSWGSLIESIPRTFHFLKIRLNIILPSTPESTKWSLSIRFPHENRVYASLCHPYALHVPPISFFSTFITRTIFGEQYRSLSSSLCSFRDSCCLLPPRWCLSFLWNIIVWVIFKLALFYAFLFFNRPILAFPAAETCSNAWSW